MTTRTKFMEWMLRDNQNSLDNTSHSLKLLSAEQFDTSRDTVRSLRNVAQAIEHLDDRFQDVWRRDVDLKADMVGAWRKQNASEDIRYEKLETSTFELGKAIAEIKKMASNFADLADAKLDVLYKLISDMADK